jgi:hypothetical protein
MKYMALITGCPAIQRLTLQVKSGTLGTYLDFSQNLKKAGPQHQALTPAQGVMTAAMWPLEWWNRGKMEQFRIKVGPRLDQ